MRNQIKIPEWSFVAFNVRELWLFQEINGEKDILFYKTGIFTRIPKTTIELNVVTLQTLLHTSLDIRVKILIELEAICCLE